MQKEQEIVSREFKVRFSDCDYTNRVRLSSLFLFMEECSVADAEEQGYGLRSLVKAGYTLMLTRQKLSIAHFPLEGEILKIKTWTKRIEGKVAWRDFAILDSRGSAVAQATTSWILVSLRTGRAVDFSEFPFEQPLIWEQNALSDELQVLPPETGGVSDVYTRQARYSDLDFNGHVNHCKYVEWCMDMFTLEEFKSTNIRSVQMNFLSQIPFGESTDLIRFKNSRHHATIFGVSTSNPDLVRFQARIGFA